MSMCMTFDRRKTRARRERPPDVEGEDIHPEEGGEEEVVHGGPDTGAQQTRHVVGCD